MANENVTKSSFPGLSDKAYQIAVEEKDKRNEMGLKTSISAVVSEAVVRTFGMNGSREEEA